MLKIALPILTAILLGFLGGYFLRDLVMEELSQLSGDNGVVPSRSHRTKEMSAGIDPTILNPGVALTTDTQAKGRVWTFDDIAEQYTVFDQLIVAYRVAAESNNSELEALIKRCLKSNDPFYNPHLIAIFF